MWLFRLPFELLDNIIDRSHHEHSSRSHRSRDSRRERSRDRNRERSSQNDHGRDRDRDRERDRERARRFGDGFKAPVNKEEPVNPEVKKNLDNAALEALEIAKKVTSSGILKFNN